MAHAHAHTRFTSRTGSRRVSFIQSSGQCICDVLVPGMRVLVLVLLRWLCVRCVVGTSWVFVAVAACVYIWCCICVIFMHCLLRAGARAWRGGCLARPDPSAPSPSPAPAPSAGPWRWRATGCGAGPAAAGGPCYAPRPYGVGAQAQLGWLIYPLQDQRARVHYL
jgi:hypothetical protein